MSTIVVLGPPECGAGDVARVLQKLGVHMGDLVDRRTLEDADFQNIDKTILEVAGGNWGKPPSREAVIDGTASTPIVYALAMKQRPGNWGWWSSRAALTIHALHPYLDDPRYIVVARPQQRTVAALCLQFGWRHNWVDLVRIYEQRIDEFIRGTDAPWLIVAHGNLEDFVEPIAEFIGVNPGDAASVIQRSESVDWRTTRGAILTDAERQWLHDRSAELQEQTQQPTILHVGVEYGGSLHCCRAGAPNARIIGVDLDVSKCIQPVQAGFELLEGDSGPVGYQECFERLNLCFIDGDHSYEYVRGDIHAWAGKVKPGGILAFHDYAPTAETQELAPWVEGVKRAVDGWIWADTTWEEIPGADSIRAFRRKPLLKRGDPFGTIAVGCPYYKSRYAFFRWWSWLLVGGLQRGDQLINTENVACEVPIPMAHNSLIMEFLMGDRDTLVIIEDDHIGPQDVLTQMREKVANWDFDIVCASYVNRRGEMMAVGYYFDSDEPNEYGEYTCRLERMNVWKEGTQPYDNGGACFGLVFIRRWVLEAMHEATGNYKLEDTFWCDWNGRNSQDVVFYARANAVGARTGVDRDNDIGHIGDKLYVMADYYKEMERHRKAEVE